MMKKKELNVEIGRRISLSRKKVGWTQEMLAENIDVTVQYISNLERGIVGASIETIIKICYALDVSSDYLLMGESNLPQGKSAAINLSNLSARQLADISQSLNLILHSGVSK